MISFPRDIAKIIADYDQDWILLDWIDEKKLSIEGMCANPHPKAVETVLEHIKTKKISQEMWRALHGNPHPDIVRLLLENEGKKFCKLVLSDGTVCTDTIHDNCWSNNNPEIVAMLLHTYRIRSTAKWRFMMANTHPEIIKLLVGNIHFDRTCLLSNSAPELAEINENWFFRNEEYLPGIHGNSNPFVFRHVMWEEDGELRVAPSLAPCYISMVHLSGNSHPLALRYLSEHIGDVFWPRLSRNPGIFRKDLLRIDGVLAILTGGA